MMRVLMALVLGIALLGSGSVLAHEPPPAKSADGRVVARVTGILFDTNALKVRVGQGPLPSLTVTNETSVELEITGRDGLPFARVGPNGVWVNISSPTWADTRGTGEAPGREASWQKTQDRPVISWLEHRAAYEDSQPPPEVVRRNSLTVLNRWSVPATYGVRQGSIEGETVWVPRPRTSSSSEQSWFESPPFTFAGLGALVVALLLILRTKRGPAVAERSDASE